MIPDKDDVPQRIVDERLEMALLGAYGHSLEPSISKSLVG